MKKTEYKPIVVISGVNLVEAGPLSVFKDAIHSFIQNFSDSYTLVLLVNNRNLFKEFNESGDIRFISFAYPKKMWLLRVWFEYVHCYFISKKIKPYLWFAMHDMSPKVVAENQVVYCHNPAAFYKFTLREFWYEKSLFFFKYFYTVFYRINIKSNKFVIVQQDWLRKIFEKKFNIHNIIVAYPDIKALNVTHQYHAQKPYPVKFIYPAMPRVFKNYEVLFSAAKKLSKSDLDFEVLATIDGTENKYSHHLKKKYYNVANIKFIGLRSRDELFRLYAQCNCLVFPSKLETWGLPVTEMKYFNKPILVANAAYAAETVGDYDKVCFFKENNAEELSNLMKGIIKKTIKFHPVQKKQIDPPFSNSWKELLTIITQ